MKLPLLAIACLNGFALTTQAQTSAPTQWHHLDPATDKIIGISTERAYQLLRTLPPPKTARKPIIVAVLDGGVDTSHQDLKSLIWTNPKEIAANGKDDDGNGYIDDLHGWNFMGLKNAQMVRFLQKEETRLYTRLQPLYGNQSADSLNPALLTPTQQREWALWKVVKPYYETKRAGVLKAYRRDSLLLTQDYVALAHMQQGFGISRIDTALLHHPPTSDPRLLKEAEVYYRDMVRRGFATCEEYLQSHQHANSRLKNQLEYGYNLRYRPALGDARPNDLTERTYGNGDATGGYTEQGTLHGTHVAGIIGADRTNGLGVKGIADQVQIMGVVEGADGDERDKDVANSIRYAVANGAVIINMSFGKYFSPDQTVVDEAIRYADQKGVLLVHVAGNDRIDLDSARMYPTPRFVDGQQARNLITVGASNRTNDSTLVASFSNYGPQIVDVFAPGVAIQSTAPKNTYEPLNGTSMATPMVAGVAAVLKTYFPELTPADLKRIILQSAVVYHTRVLKPGTRQKVDFATLSKTGGIVNLYEAVKLAMGEASVKKRVSSQKD